MFANQVEVSRGYLRFDSSLITYFIVKKKYRYGNKDAVVSIK